MGIVYCLQAVVGSPDSNLSAGHSNYGEGSVSGKKSLKSRKRIYSSDTG